MVKDDLLSYFEITNSQNYYKCVCQKSYPTSFRSKSSPRKGSIIPCVSACKKFLLCKFTANSSLLYSNCYTSKYRIGWLPFYKSVKKSWKVSHGLIFPWCNFMPIVGLISFKVWPTTYDQQELPLVINSRFIGGARLHRYAIKITSERCLISCLSSDITKLTNTLGDIYVKHPGVEYEQIKSNVFRGNKDGDRATASSNWIENVSKMVLTDKFSPKPQSGNLEPRAPSG